MQVDKGTQKVGGYVPGGKVGEVIPASTPLDRAAALEAEVVRLRTELDEARATADAFEADVENEVTILRSALNQCLAIITPLVQAQQAMPDDLRGIDFKLHMWGLHSLPKDHFIEAARVFHLGMKAL